MSACWKVLRVTRYEPVLTLGNRTGPLPQLHFVGANYGLLRTKKDVRRPPEKWQSFPAGIYLRFSGTVSGVCLGAIARPPELGHAELLSLELYSYYQGFNCI